MIGPVETLILAPLRWTLVSEPDARVIDALPTGTRDRLGGGYRHAASIQSIFFDPGSISQCKSIAEKFTATTAPFPSASFARLALEKSPAASHYGFDAKGPTWYIRNRTEAEFSGRFGRYAMRALFETPAGLRAHRLGAGQILPCLELIEALNGTQGLDEIHARAEAGDLKVLFGDLLSSGGIQLDDIHQNLRVESLPEFLFLGHSSFALRLGQTLVLFDPVALPGNSEGRYPDRSLFKLLRAASAIVISHHHWDHLHFQTLCRVRRDMLFLVPKVTVPSLANPPIAAYLNSLGFFNVRECEPGGAIDIAGMCLRFFPFHGEPFGLNSVFDAFTYHVSCAGRTLFGSVDACFNEANDMEYVIEQVAVLGPLDLFLCGVSGQQHCLPYAAAGLRYFSNELAERQELIRYHPTIDDAVRWSKILKPQITIPYAEFVFRSGTQPDLDYDALTRNAQAPGQLLHLAPMQGIRWSAARLANAS